ncbi:thermonuclease family protein [Kaistella sp. PBT33-4]|uniref:thermonuclease family protein n=1 Tax=Kaistella sp. PBT33-4 TaxID=3032000 RepID=UPI0023D882AA|nr:thermonuclease family protein [Kaistella sp. PBT33-4]MDF0718498.1 thermonuclease family protein [Kaistella sp. PBT33-4]
MKKLIPTLFFTAFSFLLFAQTHSAKIIAIKDGDTVVMLVKNKPQTIRLAHIDTPEKKQSYGTAAKIFLSERIYGREVQAVIAGKPDRNGRWIAEIFSQNQNINKELVRNGLAWHYKQYSKNDNYAALERIARQKKTGLWKDQGPIAPWQWRKMKKGKSAKVNL